MYLFIYWCCNQLVLIPSRVAVLQLSICPIIQSTVQVLFFSLETFVKASLMQASKTSQWDLKAQRQIADTVFVALPLPNLMGVYTLLFCFLLFLIPANCPLTFPPIFQWNQLHCFFEPLTPSEAAPSAAPDNCARTHNLREKTRWKVAPCRYFTVNRITSSTHQSSLSWKSRPWSTPLLGFLRWRRRDLIRRINTRKWLPWASVLSALVMKRSSVPLLSFFFWCHLTKPDKEPPFKDTELQ